MRSADVTRWSAEDRPCPICRSRMATRLGARGGRAHREGKGVETYVVRLLGNSKVGYSREVGLTNITPKKSS